MRETGGGGLGFGGRGERGGLAPGFLPPSKREISAERGTRGQPPGVEALDAPGKGCWDRPWEPRCGDVERDVERRRSTRTSAEEGWLM